LIFGSLLIKGGLIYANVFSLLVILFLSYYYTRLDFKSIRINQLLVIGKAHKTGPINLFPTALLDVISMQLPIFLITVWFSKEIAAQYRIAYALLSLPASFIGSAVAQVFYQKFSEIWPDAKTALSLLKKTWLSLALVGIIPLIIVMLFGQILIPFLLGGSWVMAGSIASVLVVMTFFSLIHSPTSVSLITMGYEKIMPFFGIAALIHRPLALYIGHLQNNVLYAIFYFVLFEVMHMLVFQFIVLKKLKATIKLI
jgi:O-antigen/teichoic acid export membrane protein